MYEEKNCQYWRTKIRDNKGNSRQLWRTLSSIMGEENNQSNHGTHCADDFAQFFSDKVDSVRQSTSMTPKQDIPTTASHSMDAWAPVTASEVEKMIGDAPNMTCNLDPAPTWLIKEFRRLLSPFLVPRLTHQRFIHHWVFSSEVQACSRLSIAKEERR